MTIGMLEIHHNIYRRWNSDDQAYSKTETESYISGKFQNVELLDGKIGDFNFSFLKEGFRINRVAIRTHDGGIGISITKKQRCIYIDMIEPMIRERLKIIGELK